MSSSDIAGIYIRPSKIHSRAALSELSPYLNQTELLPNHLFEVFVWKTKLIYQGEITNFGGNSNQLSFFSCVRAVTRQVGATRTCTALSKHKVFSFLDKEFFVGWQTINLISTLSPIWGMPCRLLKWQTYIYPNVTSGNSCPEGPGGRCSPDLYKWTCIQNNLWYISSDYGTGSQDADMFPAISVPWPQTHGTSLVSILIVTLAKFARASVNLRCWRSLTPLGVNFTSPARL